MKPETGNRSVAVQNRVSIQQSLDGHSFSLPPIPVPGRDDECLTVELILPHTMLVPEALAETDRLDDLLAANGTPLAPDEQIVRSEPVEGIVAVMAVKRDLWLQIREKYLDKVRFTTPLLHVPANTRKTVWMARHGEVLYTKVYRDGSLLLAEAIPAPTDDELQYFTDRLGRCFPLAEYDLCCAGDQTKKLKKLLGKSFNTVSCE